MKLRHNIILISFAAFFISAAVQLRSVSGQLRDYTVFNSVLHQKEGKIDLHITHDSIDVYLNSLKSELQSEKSILEQYKLYSYTLAKIQCGHTQIHPTRKVLREWLRTRNTLPIDYYLIGKRLVVNKLNPSDYQSIHEGKSKYERRKKIPVGAEILTIDHLTVEEMMDGMGDFISSDENSNDFKYFQAAHMFEFYRHLAFPFDQDSIHIKYSYKYDTTELYLQPGTAPVHTMNNRLFNNSSMFTANTGDMGKFKIVNKKYGYFRFKTFSASGGLAYDNFLEESFEELKSKNIKKLIVDLRGNTGGVMQYSFMDYIVGPDIELGKYIVEKPFGKSSNKFIKKVNVNFLRHTLISNEQNRKKRSGKFNDGIIRSEEVDEDLIYDGDIVVITDEGTFSSAAMLACHLKTLKGAKIIGRTPGGSFYAGNAGTLQVKLPSSGFMMMVNPNTFTSHLERNSDPTLIKQPDVELNPLIIDAKTQDQYYFKEATKLFQ